MTQEPDRRWILISHANPEDNAATIWFATQLSNLGYRVWADVIDLTGGEEFWSEIEEVIRQRAAKVVFLFSAESNNKEGCHRELSLAQGVAKAQELKDFVIPLRITDVPHNDANVRIHNLIMLESRSWNEGLAALLTKLDEDSVPRSPARSFQSSAEWWKARFSTSKSVSNVPESLSSNWFRILNPELQIYWHRLGQRELGPVEAPASFPWPIIEESGGIWTFATAENASAQLSSGLSIERTVTKPIALGLSQIVKERDIAFRLLLLAAQHKFQQVGLLKHELANARLCFAFPEGLIDDNDIRFETAAGRSGHRTMVGYKTRTSAKGSWRRIWHFALQPIPVLAPQLMFIIRTHVLFSEEGKDLWSSPARQLKARRNQCKNWWNDTWRDRLLAAMHWLAIDGGSVNLDVGASEPIRVSSEPVGFDCPVSYTTPPKLSDSQTELEDAVAFQELLEDSLADDDLDDEDEEGTSL